MTSESLLTAEDVAKILGCERTWVYDAAKDGRLPCVKVGRLVRFRRESIEAWIAGQERQAA